MLRDADRATGFQILRQTARQSAGTILSARTAVVLARCLRIRAYVNERRLVTVGFRDAGNLTSLAGGNTLDVDLAGTLAALRYTVSASSREDVPSLSDLLVSAGHR